MWLMRPLRRMFRELLVYHHGSLEYRAKLIALFVASNDTLLPCQEEIVEKIAQRIYGNDIDRSTLLVDTVLEYRTKVITDNGLDFDDLLLTIKRDTKHNNRYAKKIDLALLGMFRECNEQLDEEERLFQERICEFLTSLKNNYLRS